MDVHLYRTRFNRVRYKYFQIRNIWHQTTCQAIAGGTACVFHTPGNYEND